MQRDAVLYNSMNDVVEKASGWRSALAGVQSMLSVTIQLDAASSSVRTPVCQGFGLRC